MVQEALEKVMAGRDLEETEVFTVVKEILGGKVTLLRAAALLTALRIKGVKESELLGAARALKEAFDPWKGLENGFLSMDREEINVDEETMKRTSLTMSKGTRTFNVSTAVALVVAGVGTKVVRHAGLVPSEFVGTEHVLRALGVEPEISPALAKRCLEEANVAFIYTPWTHPGARTLYEIRRQLGFRTLLNLAGPLANPCGAQAVYLGVYDPSDMISFAQVSRSLGTKSGIIVHGDDTFDEASITGTTRMCQLKANGFEVKEIVPEEVGLKRAKPEEIKGGDAIHNALTIREVLSGQKGPKRDLVVLNAALALMAMEKAQDILQAMAMAKESIDSGAAMIGLNKLIRLTHESVFLRKGF